MGILHSSGLIEPTPAIFYCVCESDENINDLLEKLNKAKFALKQYELIRINHYGFLAAEILEEINQE